MKLKYNRKTELEVVGLGVFEPGQFVIADDESRAKKYLDTGYFDKVKEKKEKVKIENGLIQGITKEESKLFEDIPKKSKKKGDDQ